MRTSLSITVFEGKIGRASLKADNKKEARGFVKESDNLATDAL